MSEEGLGEGAQQEKIGFKDPVIEGWANLAKDDSADQAERVNAIVNLIAAREEAARKIEKDDTLDVAALDRELAIGEVLLNLRRSNPQNSDLVTRGFATRVARKQAHAASFPEASQPLPTPKPSGRGASSF